MKATAHAKYIRISPRKVQIVLDLIRNKPVDVALATLKHTRKSACEPLIKLLNSAVANADNNFSMDTDSLYVSECFACPGPILKRMQPRSRGMAYRINKRTSHITLVLKEKEE